MELLADQMTDLLISDPSVENLSIEKLSIKYKVPTLYSDTIIVQNPGMARWLSYIIASKLGISANINFPLPSSFIWSIFESAFLSKTNQNQTTKEHLIWAIFSLLSSSDTPFQQYLENDAGNLKAYKLAKQLGDIFDKYMVYRPDWLLEWEKESINSGIDNNEYKKTDSKITDKIIKTCWIQLQKSFQIKHRAQLHSKFAQLCDDGDIDKDTLPPKIIIFGIDTMPPIILDTFFHISKITDVYIFLLNPCQEYWSDIRTKKEKLRNQLSKTDEITIFGDENTSTSILASMGKSVRDYLEQIYLYDFIDEDLFEENCEDDNNDINLLHTIQNRALNLNSDIDTSIADKLTDKSIQIHSCYSKTREIESLQDSILSILDNSPDIKPRDIVVMAPNINNYAAIIDAVFSKSEKNHIPISIADRSQTESSPILSAFIKLLKLPKSRFALNDLIEILEVKEIHEKFSLTADDIELIQHWLNDSGIRWGIDGDHKAKLDLPEDENNSWIFGIKRLLLGIASSESKKAFSFDGIKTISPYKDIEGNVTKSLGNFISFFELLCNWSEVSEKNHSVVDWQIIINDLIDNIIKESEKSENALISIRTALDDLNSTITDLGITDLGIADPGIADIKISKFEISLEVITSYLEEKTSIANSNNPFLTGQVTFCNLQPMRSIPFKVVCLIGMNDQDFPSKDLPPNFDLMTHTPRRRCDRSKKDDDRYLFLESIISAREIFYLSYIGKNINDDSEKQPTILINELIENIAESSGISFDECKAKLLVVHPLQPFSKKYFNEKFPELFSYAEEWLPEPHKSSINPIQGAEPFIDIDSKMPFPDDKKDNSSSINSSSIKNEQLIKFFKAPVQYLLKERLNLFIPQRTWSENISKERIEDTETFYTDPLTRYFIKEENIRSFLEIDQKRDVKRDVEGDLYSEEDESFNADNYLHLIPHGNCGRIDLEQIQHEISNHRIFTSTSQNPPINNRFIQGTLPLTQFKLNCGPFEVGENSYYRISAGKEFRAKHIIEIWINHLAINAVSDTEIRGLFYKENDFMNLSPIKKSQAHKLLNGIAEMYHIGLEQFLPFFPDASYRYAKAFFENGEDKEAALYKSLSEWKKEQSEKYYLYNSLIFNDNNFSPIEMDLFSESSLAFFLPFFEYVSFDEDEDFDKELAEENIEGANN